MNEPRLLITDDAIARAKKVIHAQAPEFTEHPAILRYVALHIQTGQETSMTFGQVIKAWEIDNKTSPNDHDPRFLDFVGYIHDHNSPNYISPVKSQEKILETKVEIESHILVVPQISGRGFVIEYAGNDYAATDKQITAMIQAAPHIDLRQYEKSLGVKFIRIDAPKNDSWFITPSANNESPPDNSPKTHPHEEKPGYLGSDE